MSLKRRQGSFWIHDAGKSFFLISVRKNLASACLESRRFSSPQFLWLTWQLILSSEAGSLCCGIAFSLSLTAHLCASFSCAHLYAAFQSAFPCLCRVFSSRYPTLCAFSVSFVPRYRCSLVNSAHDLIPDRLSMCAVCCAHFFVF